MINSSALPHTTITGKITNNHLKLKYSRYRHTPYLVIMMYVEDGKVAHLIPVVAFNTNARRLVKRAHQGDLISVQATIDAKDYHNHFETSLYLYGWTFLGSKAFRDKKKSIKQLFPVIPENYHKINSNNNYSHQHRSNSRVSNSDSKKASKSNKASYKSKSFASSKAKPSSSDDTYNESSERQDLDSFLDTKPSSSASSNQSRATSKSSSIPTVSAEVESRPGDRSFSPSSSSAQASSSNNQSNVISISASVIKSSTSDSRSNNKSSENNQNDDQANPQDWMNDISQLDNFQFPGMS